MRIRFLLVLFAMAGLALAQTPIIGNDAILNGASFQRGVPITGGSLISIFGTQLASRIAAADTIPLSASLGGVTVTFTNGSTSMNARLLYVQPDDPANQLATQINCQVPWNLVPNGVTTSVSVVVTRDGVASAPAQVTIGPFSPGIFSSGGRAVVQNSVDGTLAWPVGVIPGATTHPAKIGDVVIVYATGLGAVDTPVDDGQNALDKTRNTLTKPIVLVGGVSAPVQFSGLSPQFVGVNQLNVMIPNVVPGDNVMFQLQVGGITTSNSLTIAVSR